MENLVDVLFLAVMVVPSGFVIVAGVGPGGFLVSIGASIAALFAMALWTRQRDWRACGIVGQARPVDLPATTQP